MLFCVATCVNKSNKCTKIKNRERKEEEKKIFNILNI